MSLKGLYRFSFVMVFLMIFSGGVLSSITVSADDVVDNISIRVPVSCSLSGTGMNSHTATINNGEYNSNIGTTTFKVFCNDEQGFAVYAIGYTDEIDGKNVMAAATDSDYDIATGTAITGDSQWAMKLSPVTSPTPKYPVTIQNNFDNFHTVPDDYTLVAKRESSTDIGVGAEGASFTSTYQVYVSTAQPADTYTGKVKYVLIHPNDNEEIPVREDQIAVLFDGNGLTFPGGASTNRVVYGDTCTSMYVGTTPAETVGTSNLVDGEYDGTPYSEDEFIHETYTLDGADMVRVVVDYGLTGDTGSITIAEGEWEGWAYEDPEGMYYEIWPVDEETDSPVDVVGTRTFDIEGDTVTFEISIWGEPIEDYDYGAYAKFYPLYYTEQSGTEAASVCNLSSTPISGAYVEPTIWNGAWYTFIDGEKVWFEDDSEIFWNYIMEDAGSLMGSTIRVYAKNPYRIYYDGNGAPAGTMSGIYTEFDDLSERVGLRSPNFAKTGYGFAGWSENPNATVNGSDKIYGPNENIIGGVLHYDSNRETTLYAVWVPSSGNMQNYSCSSLASGKVVALTDTRDNNVYTVGKMQDGNCWMMENLRLDAANSADSTQAQGFGGVFTGLADSEDVDFRSNVSNSKYTVVGVGSTNRMPRYNNNNTNIGGTNSQGVPLAVVPECNDDYSEYCVSNLSTHAQWYSYGNDYSWPAAMANTSAFATNGASNSADTSICPAGWTLPYGGNFGLGLENGSFSYLDEQMGGNGFAGEDFVYDEELINNWFSYPNNIILGGYWSDTSADRGTFGTYWTRTNYTGVYAWRLSISPYSSGYSTMHRSIASTIRCIVIDN